MEGAGVFVNWYDPRSNWVIGSNQDDSIYSQGGGYDAVRSGGGDDTVVTGDGNDRVYGGWGNDRLNTGGGDDLVAGERGNDEIDGGDGSDTLLLSGSRAEYDLSIVDGNYRLSHLNGAGLDGIDTFANIEALQFADQTVALEDWIV
ncbi:calcium-binding protein [Jiella marina]|uniref:calcium-binding protein n=1 Tax=Jiella sp. LLJ827 TaxID=2917712 RepID=UPI002100DE11|nr:hypothetical protein [Jiella sp. LLJ827]